MSPYIIEKGADFGSLIHKGPKLKTSIRLFTEQFPNTSRGKAIGRAHCPFTTPKPELEAKLACCSPPASHEVKLKSEDHEYVRQLTGAGLYGMVKNRPYYGTEYLQCASIRVALPGANRRIFVMPWASMVEVMKLMPAPAGKTSRHTEVTMAAQALKGITTNQDAESLLRQHAYEIRAAPESIVYVPMAFFCAEDVIVPEAKEGKDVSVSEHAIGIKRSLALNAMSTVVLKSFQGLHSMAEKEKLEDGKAASFMELILKSQKTSAQ